MFRNSPDNYIIHYGIWQVYSRRFFSFSVILCLFVSLLYLCSSCFTGTADDSRFVISDSVTRDTNGTMTTSDRTGQSTVTTGNELVLIWNPELSTAEQRKLLSGVPILTVLEAIEDYMLVSVADTDCTPEFIESLRSIPGLRVAEPNYTLTLSSYEASESAIHSSATDQNQFRLHSVTNDEYSDNQWSFDNQGFYFAYYQNGSPTVQLSSSGIDMNVLEGWTLYSETVAEPREVLVAVIDTGIDIMHPELADSIWVNTGEIPDDGIDNDGNGYIDDVNGWDFYNSDNTVSHYEYDSDNISYHALPEDNDNHGTHIAGIIAAAADNGIGVAGVASCAPVRIIPLKIHGGASGNGSVASAIKAIKYAVMMGADVCNLSWGAELDGTFPEALLTVMKEADLLFVSAAGNSGSDNDITPMYPASFELDNMISVTFINAFGTLTDESNYGASSVDLAAPGVDICSTIVGGYAIMKGSSMAVPHVTAIAAILYSMSDQLYPLQIKKTILDSVKPLSALEGRVLSPGIPDLFRAVSTAGSLLPDTEAPVLFLERSFYKEFLKLLLTADDLGGAGIRVIKYASGTKTLRAFQSGTLGTSVTGTTLTLTKAGNYSFYISDYAGNETLVHYHLTDDTLSPKIDLFPLISYSGSEFMVVFDLTEEESGIRQVVLLPGECNEEDFAMSDSAAELVPVDGRILLRLSESGTYSCMATDYRGNKTIRCFELLPPENEPASLFESSLTLLYGETKQLQPANQDSSSSVLYRYSSSDSSVVSVNQWGGLTAHNPGTAAVTIMAPGGIETICEVTVIE